MMHQTTPANAAQGFAPFGVISAEGMAVFERIYAGAVAVD